MKIPPTRWLLWVAVVLTALLMLFIAGLAHLLPFYLEKRLIPEMAEAFGLAPEQVEVRRIGWRGADLGPIQLASAQGAALSVAAIQVDYSPLGLLRKEVGGITLAGLDIAVRIRADGLTIAGQELAPSSGGGGTIGPDTLLPVTLGRLSIVRSRLRVDIDHGQGRYQLPFDVQLQTDQLPDGKLNGELRSSLFGDPFVVTGRVDKIADRFQVRFSTDHMALTTIKRLLPQVEGMDTIGTAAVVARAGFSLTHRQLTDLSATARLVDSRVTTPAAHLRTLAAGPEGDRPLVLTLEGARMDALRWRAAPFQIDGPLPLTVNHCEGTLAVTGQYWSMTGQVDAVLPRQNLPGGGSIEAPLPTTLEVSARQTLPVTAASPLVFDLHGRVRGPMQAALGEGQLSIDTAQLSAEGEFRDGVLMVDARLGGQAVKGQSAQGNPAEGSPAEGSPAPLSLAQLKVAEMTASASIRVPLSAAGRDAFLTTRATINGLRVATDDGWLELPELALDLRGTANARQPWGFSGRLRSANGQMMASALDLTAAGLNFDLPLAWPVVEAPKAGPIDLAHIRWGGQDLGGVTGFLRQTADGLDINLRHANKRMPGLDLFVKGRLTPAGGHIQARIPPYELETATDLGRFHPSARGFQGSGRVSAAADLNIDAHGPKASGRFNVSDGRVSQAASRLTLEGIELTVNLSDLLAVKSLPRQQVAIERLAFGDLAAERLSADFQIESAHTLLVEKAGLDWCQGRVNAAALRIDTSKTDYRLTLFCDRLNLARLLEQLGAADASGRGSVNGRIPISWVADRLTFDNGFLYSTPGESGTIRLTGTQALLAGLPPGSPQHTQLDIATEALKDYSYQWAKLQLVSEGDILLLKLQLDGKPNRLLPFAYDQALGQFKRVSGVGQAEFKGISIDLNFRSPINDIIHYQELFNTK